MQPEKKGFFARLKEGMSRTRDQLAAKVDQLVGSTRQLNDAFYEELEAILVSADMGVTTSAHILSELRARVREEGVRDAAKARELLRYIMVRQFIAPPFLPGKPAVLFIVGVNGVGKTTTVGKLALRYKEDGRSVLICAADTFRAAATEQLSIWAERAGVPIVKHGEGADPAAVVFDALRAAKARGCDMVIIDTAGRLHNKEHLVEELKKMKRVIEREMADADLRSLLVLDATTGQSGLQQAKVFTQAVQLDGIILTKLDGTAKGGIAFSVKTELNLPVRFICVGEGIADQQPFVAEEFVDAILPVDGR